MRLEMRVWNCASQNVISNIIIKYTNNENRLYFCSSEAYAYRISIPMHSTSCLINYNEKDKTKKKQDHEPINWAVCIWFTLFIPIMNEKKCSRSKNSIRILEIKI